MSKFILSIAFILSFSISGDCQELTFKEKNGLYGFFYKETQMLDYQYDSIVLQPEGSYAVRKAGNWGVVYLNGKEIIPCKYEVIRQSSHYKYAATKNGLMGMLDTTGMLVLDFFFDDIDHENADYQVLVKYDGKWCYYKNGQYNYDIDELVFLFPDTMPVFAGCLHGNLIDMKKCSDEKLVHYVSARIKYPALARRKGIEGVVLVSFVVSREGEINNPVIFQSLDGGCNEEVLRIIKIMPKWSPGFQDGMPVNTLYAFPVIFKLKN